MTDLLEETLRGLGFDEIPDDGPDLPQGCVPYLPCTIDTLRELVAAAGVTANDVFVDIGAGVGRAMTAVHLLTGARVIGLEVQAALAQRARDLTRSIDAATIIEGDAALQMQHVASGTVFLLYCPFGGNRLAQVLASLQELAHPIRVCTVDIPPLELRWLVPVVASPHLAVYQSERKSAR